MTRKDTTQALTYWKGDRARYTGRVEWLHGGLFHELLLLEGHRKGDRVWTMHGPEPRDSASK